MNRNDYDTDVTVFSPQGRIFQVEYAMEAVNQGSACVGLAAGEYVVLAALKRLPSKLATHQRKLLPIDEHLGVCISGLTADARSLCKYLRGECLNHKYVFGSELPVGRLMSGLADKMQECTQSYVRRPYGVGMLVAGADKTGAHLFQTCPSGNVYEYKAHAIGARAQSARTYLEKHHEGFGALAAAGDKETLLLHALRALASCTEAEEELSVDNASLGVVKVGAGFEVVDGTSMAPLIASLADFNPDPPAPAAAAAAAGTAADAAAADAADEDDDMAMA